LKPSDGAPTGRDKLREWEGAEQTVGKAKSAVPRAAGTAKKAVKKVFE
jgi:uncharacterized protein YjbJ (UPF0337 family)